MKRYTKLTAIVLAAALLCGCEKIPDWSDNSESSDSHSNSSDKSGGFAEQITDTYSPDEYKVLKQSYVKKFEAEKGAFNGKAMDENGELENSDKDGFVSLNEGQ